MSAVSDLLDVLRKHPDWTEVDGDDFEEQETEGGVRFNASVEIRETQPAGWQSHYFAELDHEGDWDDPYEGSDDDDDEEEG